MSRKLLTVSFLCLVFALSTTAFGGPITDPVKWSQLPDLDLGIDIPSSHDIDRVVTDDWQCTDPRAVLDVHWWGSYLDNVYQEPVGFFIRIYADLPGALPSQPDGLLHEEYHFFADVNEEWYGVQDWTGHDAYQYYVYLKDPFQQQVGEIYWLSIQAVSSSTWGWKTSFEHWRDDAVTSDDPYGPTWEKVIYPPGHPLEGQPLDMAFELTVIPEPSLFALLAAGVLFPLLFRRRR